MGRIKSALVKRTSRKLIEISPVEFDKSFERNKKLLGSHLPSKKIRNKIAGYIARIKKRTKNIIEEPEKR